VENIRKLIAGRIIKARVQRGLTQDDMAEHLSLSQSSYSRLENGSRSLREIEIQKICELFDMTSDELLGLSSTSDYTANEPTTKYKKEKPKLRLSIEFTDDDAEPDGPLVQRLSEMIRQINAKK
jgi:transcriptional regulator with XRE-family HTH domain